jgi:transcriptional regulator GlxA family with amidase domain
MMLVSILIPAGDISLANIEGTYQIFNEVNARLISSGKEPIFEVQLVGLSKENRMLKGMFSVHPDVLISNEMQSGLIIIPALRSELGQALEANREAIPWIIDQYKKGASIASLCTGSFLLAATGLLNGKKCATHWSAANEFRKMFPLVQLVPEKVVAGEAGIYSSGGAFSSFNLILYLVEKYADRQMAILCSKIFQIEMERNSQSPFMIFNPQKEHGDEVIMKVQEYIEQHPAQKFTVDQLAAKFNIGRRNFERRFKKSTSNTVVEYIQRVKVEAAKMNLERTRENVSEVMYGVGYSDPKAFRVTFKRFTGLSPVAYRSRYNKESAL